MSRVGDATESRPWQDLPGPRRLMPGVYHAWGDGRQPRPDAVRCAVVIGPPLPFTGTVTLDEEDTQ